jgi:hypothetical protein
MSVEIHGCFKSHISAACQALGVPWSHFADETGLPGFLIDARDVECPREFAAKALVALSHDAAAPCRKVLCAAVCTFLDERLGRPVEDPGQERRIKDLKQQIDGRVNESAYRGLIDAWHD